jgi:hypothetical protein
MSSAALIPVAQLGCSPNTHAPRPPATQPVRDVSRSVGCGSSPASDAGRLAGHAAGLESGRCAYGCERNTATLFSCACHPTTIAAPLPSRVRLASRMALGVGTHRTVWSAPDAPAPRRTSAATRRTVGRVPFHRVLVSLGVHSRPTTSDTADAPQLAYHQRTSARLDSGRSTRRQAESDRWTLQRRRGLPQWANKALDRMTGSAGQASLAFGHRWRRSLSSVSLCVLAQTRALGFPALGPPHPCERRHFSALIFGGQAAPSGVR